MSPTTSTKKKSKTETIFLVVRHLTFDLGGDVTLVVGTHRKNETATNKVDELNTSWEKSGQKEAHRVLGITRADHWVVPIPMID